MICRLTGRLIAVSDTSAVLDLGGVGYECLVPASAVGELRALSGNEVTLFTVQYLEGNPAGSHFTPRIIAFLSASDREFFNTFVKVKGISTRKALRAMALPVASLAAAIENADPAALAGLPEIGKKTATQIIHDLGGKMAGFLLASSTPLPVSELTEPQRTALDILVQWGDKRADAQRWVSAAVDADPSLTHADEIVRAAYRMKGT